VGQVGYLQRRTYSKFYCDVKQCPSERKRLKYETFNIMIYQQEGDKYHNKENISCIMKIIMIQSVLKYIILEHQTVHDKENKRCM